MRHVLALDLKDDAELIAAYEAHHRAVWPEVQMLVVATCDQLGVAQREDRPDADLLAGGVVAFESRIHDLRRGRRVEPAVSGDPVAGDQNELHPQRVMRKDADESVDDAGI